VFQFNLASPILAV